MSGKVAVSDTLTDPRLQFPVIIEKAIENSFFLGMQEALKRAYAGPPEKTADQAKPKPTPLKSKE
jgi:hypothetical protein